MSATIDRQRLNAIEQRRAKDAAKLAFAAYETAVGSGDSAGQEAAKSRFIAASKLLNQTRR